MKKLAEFGQFSGTKTDGALDALEPYSGLSRNVVPTIDGTALLSRWGASDTGLPRFALKRTTPTLWAFTHSAYPGLVFVAQMGANGSYLGDGVYQSLGAASGDAVYANDITGESPVLALGIYRPDTVAYTEITGTSVTENANGGVVMSVKGEV